MSESQNKLQGVHKANKIENLSLQDTTLELIVVFATAFRSGLKELLCAT